MRSRVAPGVAVCVGLLLLVPMVATAAAQSYVVQPGDTLWEIAARFGISVAALQSANQLSNPDALKLGQRLIIPEGASPRRTGASAAPASGTQTHIVQNGDTLWVIGSRYHVSVEAIIAANRLSNPDALKLGQQLIIPGRIAQRTPVPSARPAPPTQYTWHTVSDGDTLWTLASRYRTTVNTLIALNDLPNPDALRLGQRLKVPAPAPQPAAKPIPKPAVSTPVTKPAASAARPVLSSAPAPASTALRPAPPLRALPHSAVAPVRLLPRSAIPSRGAKWASTLQQVAVRVLGVRYRWGGTSPRGFDCSGFVNYVLRGVGVQVPRTTFAMFKTGRAVARNNLQIGDVVFFQTVSPGPSHAGVYVGNNLFMHSSSGIGRVSITSLDYRYYRARYLGARRF